MDRRLDLLLVNPNSSLQVYQGLSHEFSAIEPPVWSLLLAESCRSKGFGVEILDCDAERLGLGQTIQRIKSINPRLLCWVIYGQNPNSGTTNMAGAVHLCRGIKEICPDVKVCFAGSHTQALPLEVLSVPGVDFVLLNEGVYALRNLLSTDLEDVKNVKGIGWNGKQKIDGLGEFTCPVLNEVEKTVPQGKIEEDLPGYAWDLLPKIHKPLDRYRAHNWFPHYGSPDRSPYAALYTSLGCPFRCDFCMINSINRDSNDTSWSSAKSAKIRYFPTWRIIKEIDELVKSGVKTIRFSDEMFFLNQHHYVPLLSKIRDRWGELLNLWAYARVDTVKPEHLNLFRSAGVKWLCLGIETANQTIRREVTKGSYEEVDIRDVVKQIENAGVEVIANYIFGLPDDTMESMQQTLDLSIELNTAMWNAYPCMALPGSPLYQTAKENNWELPSTFSGYSFHSYDCQPLPTKHLSAAEVLRFRDEAFQKYWSRPEFLSMIENKFGPPARENIEKLLKIKLNRRLLGDVL